MLIVKIRIIINVVYWKDGRLSLALPVKIEKSLFYFINLIIRELQKNTLKNDIGEAAFLLDAADALIAAINDGTVECPTQPLQLPGNNENTTNEIAYDLGLKVYPNPIREIVNIYFETSEYKTTVVIYDLYGKQMWIQETEPYHNTLKVNISAGQFGSGMYIVSVSNETGTQVQRVVVNR